MGQPRLGIETIAVDDKGFGPDTKLRQGTVHGKKRSMENIYFINLLRCHDTYSPCQRIVLNLLAQGITLLLRQLLRVVQRRVVIVGWQDDGSSIDAAGETAAPRLIASCL